MSEPEAGTRHPFWKWVKILLEVLGTLAAVATILALVFYFQERFEILEEEEYKRLVDLKDRHKQGELIAKTDCPLPETPPPPTDPEVDQATILMAAIDELIQEVGFLAKYIDGPDFFDRFDKWRSKAKNKLADGQKLIRDAGWTSNEDWVGTFHAQTHIKRDLGREPYRPEEFRGFLKSGSQVLERMKREVLLNSGNGIPPDGSSSPPNKGG